MPPTTHVTKYFAIMKLEEYLKTSLGYKSVEKTGRGGGGCISQGETLKVIKGNGEKELIYVKGNKSSGVSSIHALFEGLQQLGYIKL